MNREVEHNEAGVNAVPEIHGATPASAEVQAFGPINGGRVENLQRTSRIRYCVVEPEIDPALVRCDAIVAPRSSAAHFNGEPLCVCGVREIAPMCNVAGSDYVHSLDGFIWHLGVREVPTPGSS